KDELKTIPDEGIAKTGKADVFLENGYLAFKNMNAVDSVINVLNSMNRQGKDAWEQQMGLKSARAEFDILFDEYEKLTTKEEFLKFKVKYADKLKFNEKDETDCSIGFPFKTIYFLPVLNSHGIYKVGNSLIKFTKEDQIIILDGDLSKLNNLEAYVGNENVFIVPKLKSGNTDIEYDNFEWDNPNVAARPNYWFTTPNGNDRRYRNSLRRENYWYNLGIPSSGWKVYVYQTGQKKGTFGWRDYKTVLGLQNISIKVDNFPTYQYAGGLTSNEVYSSTTVIAQDFVSGSTWMFNYNPGVIFSAQTKSRGYDVWVDINH
ncbi:MAG: DUF4848 domain-containing protein, partial [Bacteroidota bacterium]|nr:DUF4848 domain-containing protein [Bacteroidota bacterium]